MIANDGLAVRDLICFHRPDERGTDIFIVEHNHSLIVIIAKLTLHVFLLNRIDCVGEGMIRLK